MRRFNMADPPPGRALAGKGRTVVNRRTSVSMKDVAALAKVSVGTVSNVLNAPELVAEDTRERVELAIEKLGWVRNESARQLRVGHSRSIGMLVMDIANPFFADVVRGAEEFLDERGYSVQIGNSDQRPDREDRLLDQFERQRVRGVLLAPIGENPERAVRLRQRGIPVVLVDRAAGTTDFCSVGMDDIEGGRVATDHLINQGHRRLAFVGGPSSLAQVRDRRRGVDLALASAGRETSLLVVSTPLLDVASGTVAAAELLALPDAERPTAVFAANDLLAIGLLQGFVLAGVRVPEDVALIGYDDIAFAAAAAVPLSSIRQARGQLGAQAAELLFEEITAIDSGEPHQHRTVRAAPELVVRRSSAYQIVTN
ncbi:MAG: LacI family DNA-binding transcriptional regulator [Propionicimonas sp.]|uniref:LacI family DNA-binding transcriptional regulator n=1 Tax=Propionicimonas sp. TaxID=1955623 RepID=UPI002B2183E7|nr:LacI family DNA-binding transcriptional regulator [Propionicimonas sp.]MEA4945074.1 LacI family DNA-binding transcriptional regulator [Propionicimonas sp.]